MERLEAKIDKRGPDECWPWTGTISGGGYGVITDRGSNNLPAHRLYYERTVGPIASGMKMDHECHNIALVLGKCRGGDSCRHRRCCNPAHLVPRTQGENTRRGGSPTILWARLRQGVRCPCGCGHVFDPVEVAAATYVSYDQPED